MQKQSSRLYYKGKDHKDIYFNGNYHCAMFVSDKLVWEKYLDGKWVYNTQFGTNDYRIETLDPIKKEIRNQAAYTYAPNMTHNGDCYIVYAPVALAHYPQNLYISNAGGDRLTRCTDLITRDFRFAAALNDRILVCDNGTDGIIYELQHNKEEDTYILKEIYNNRLPGEDDTTYQFHPYLKGKGGAYLIGFHTDVADYQWFAFGKDNIFKEFAMTPSSSRYCCCQDAEKVYLLAYIRQTNRPYLSYPVVYIYDGKSTATLHPNFGGRFTTNVAMIKRKGKFIIYEQHSDGGSNYYVDIYVTGDFSSFKTIQFFKCTIPYENGFWVSGYGGNKFYKKVAFVSDYNRTSVDDDTHKVNLPISSIEDKIPVYYESGKINEDREDMCIPFTISGYLFTTFLVAYLDNLYFEDSDGNFG